MDKIEALIKKLIEAKEELNKNMNCGPDMAAPNMAKDEVKPDKGFGKIIIKDPKPVVKSDKETEKDALDAAMGKMAKDEAFMMGEGCTMKDMKTHANGQWSMKKGAFKELESKLEHEGKSKESAGAIAYEVGKKKYGKEGMEHKAEEARKVESPSKREGDHNADQNDEEPKMDGPANQSKRDQAKIKPTEKLERKEK